jgi:hypothetical protein
VLSISALYECSVWEVLSSRSAQYEECSVWVLSIRSAQYQQCSALWVLTVWVLSMKSAQYECSTWGVLSISSAQNEECSVWGMLSIRSAQYECSAYEECSVSGVLKILPLTESQRQLWKDLTLTFTFPLFHTLFTTGLELAISSSPRITILLWLARKLWNLYYGLCAKKKPEKKHL